VAIVGRNPAKTEAVAADLRTHGDAPVDVHIADLASLDQVRDVAREIAERHEKIDVLVSNAGVYRLRRAVTVDGYEETFAVNHLAPFLLVNLLRDRITASGTRVVVVASGAHLSARLDFDDLLLERSYGSWRAYSRAKLANIMFTYALARRLSASGATANCLHPGFVSTGLGTGNRIPVKPFYLLMKPITISPERGADTAVWLATSPDVQGVSGKYFYKRHEARSSTVSHDEEVQERLWRESAALTGAAAW
jgi:NAD(P)-dependent dehydrogenase (short-subunit alcohol dehydrogenase family)